MKSARSFWDWAPSHQARWLATCFAYSLAIGACQSDAWNGNAPMPDAAMFQAEVYPVLMRDCSFNACHGAAARFFQVFGPGRTRLDPRLDQGAPLEPLELQVSYERARSMLVSNGAVTTSLLLVKPLAEHAGGVGHGGVDDLRRNVYESALDPGYVTLLKWAQTATGSRP
jgi:hypothetical protein